MNLKRLYLVKQMSICQHTYMFCQLADGENKVDQLNVLELQSARKINLASSPA